MRLLAATTIAAGALSLVLTGCASANQAENGAGSAPSSGVSIPGGGTTTGPGMGGTAVTPQPTSALARAAAARCPLPPTSPQNNPAAKPVPDDLQVRWVLRCRVVQGGAGQTLVAEQSTSDPTDLVRALRVPSAQRAKIVCPMMAVYLPNFALVQPDGQLFIPKLPLNNCGMPQSAVVTALNHLTFAQISSRPAR